jgi:hypothetical protein
MLTSSGGSGTPLRSACCATSLFLSRLLQNTNRDATIAKSRGTPNPTLRPITPSCLSGARVSAAEGDGRNEDVLEGSEEAGDAVGKIDVAVTEAVVFVFEIVVAVAWVALLAS